MNLNNIRFQPQRKKRGNLIKIIVSILIIVALIFLCVTIYKLNIDKIISKSVPIEGQIVKITIDSDTTIGDLEFNPKTIEVTGPEQLINKIQYAHINIALDMNPINSSKTIKEKFILVDINNEEISDDSFKTDVNSVEIFIPIH